MPEASNIYRKTAQHDKVHPEKQNEAMPFHAPQEQNPKEERWINENTKSKRSKNFTLKDKE